MVVLALASPLGAQTPPQPAVQLSRAGFDRGTWPVDLNGDGRTDLVGSITVGTPATIAVAIGRGNGTFTELARTSVRAEPIGVGDFNGDGRRDVVVTGVAILPGNGNGTFGTPRAVTGPPALPDEESAWYGPSRAMTVDLNGDGRLDLGLLSSDGLRVYPGNGDFTFGPAMLVGSGDDITWSPRQAIAADFNGDGRRDIAVAYTFHTVDVFINNGRLLFTPSRVTLPTYELWDITAGDLNRDGRIDLVTVQARTAQPAMSTEVWRRPLAPPIWLKLMRRGSAVYFAYRQTTTDPWTLQRSVEMPHLVSLAVGFAVSSHVDGTLATATFDNVSIVEAPTWQNQDIGAVGRPGGRVAGEVHRSTVEGSGADIWGTADAFHYEFTPWFGDGTITARVLSVENTHAWAKAGVMVRESTAAGSKHVMAIVSPGKGVAMQRRASTNGASANAAVAAGAAPRWLRLTRAGDTFTGHTSTDGVTWTLLGTTTVSMDDNVLIGLPVTSHNNATLATAVFDDVVVRH
jgi:regulation of enolase protein 1 (concanavalin A-like superfamily)